MFQTRENASIFPIETNEIGRKFAQLIHLQSEDRDRSVSKA